MKGMHFLSHVLAVLLVFSVLSLTDKTASVQAQTESDPSCPLLVQQALTDLGNNCTGIGRNSACYGYNRVEASFSQAVPEGYFSHPADTTEMATIRTIQTAPLDLSTSEWGIAVLNVQANVPDTLPGQAVTFLLLGDTQVENAVPPEATYTGPATAILQSETNLYENPAADASIIGQIAAGTVLQFEVFKRRRTMAASDYRFRKRMGQPGGGEPNYRGQQSAIRRRGTTVADAGVLLPQWHQ